MHIIVQERKGYLFSMTKVVRNMAHNASEHRDIPRFSNSISNSKIIAAFYFKAVGIVCSVDAKSARQGTNATLTN